MASNAARARATKKYQKKAYDRVIINVKKGNKDIIKAYAEKNGTSINGVINKALAEKIPGFIPFE